MNEVLDIADAEIEPPPQYGTDVDQAFLTGMGKVKDEVIMLLDADKILSSNEMKKLELVQEEGKS